MSARIIATPPECRDVTPEEVAACRVPPRPDMAHHFEALALPVKPRRAPLTFAQLTARVFTVAALALAVVCAANIALSAPGKVARTVGLHHQIEEAR